MSVRSRALKSIFTGKSYLPGTPSVPNTVSSKSSFHFLNDFFNNFLRGKTNSKQFLDAYGENPLVYQIIDRISKRTASIDLISVDSEGEKVNGNSRILEFLNDPNPDQTKTDLIIDCCVNLLATGNLYQWFIKGVGMGEEFRILPSSQVTLVISSKGTLLNYIYKDSFGTEHPILPEDMNHIKTNNSVNLSNTTVYLGMSPLQASWVVVQSSNEKFNASASIFKNKGIAGILTNKSDTLMHPSERERLQEQFDKEVGGSDKFGKIKISNVDLAYIQTGMSPTDLKLLEGIVSDLRLLCSTYGMPSVLFNDNEKSTYNNVSEARKTAAIDVYIPLLEKIISSTSMFLSKKLNVDENIVPDITSIEELRLSTNKVLQSILSMPDRVAQLFVGAMTVDELRAIGMLEGIDNTNLVSTLNGKETNTGGSQENQSEE